MTMNRETIQEIVMRRVRTIHALRTSATGAGISVLILVGSLYFIGREVWVAHVIQNMPRITDIPAVMRFGFAAFSHTHPTVQILTLSVIAAALWFLREAYRVLRIRPQLTLT
jgi:hypothetical protein